MEDVFMKEVLFLSNILRVSIMIDATGTPPGTADAANNADTAVEMNLFFWGREPGTKKQNHLS